MKEHPNIRRNVKVFIRTTKTNGWMPGWSTADLEKEGLMSCGNWMDPIEANLVKGRRSETYFLERQLWV